MTSLRAGLQPPRRAIAEDELARLRAWLDGQSRIGLAAWASHEHECLGGAVDYDEHLLLGIADSDFHGEDVRALDLGLENEVPGIHAWLDLFALSDAEAVRGFAEVLWERGEPPTGSLDPLDFCFTWEPLAVPAAAVEAFAGLVRAVPELRRVEACGERLWKNGEEVRYQTAFHLDFEVQRPGSFERVEGALGESGIRVSGNSATTAGLPRDPRIRTAVLYER